MALHILKCTKCNTYTLKKKCSKCDSETAAPIPAKYSPEDNYGKYRRIAKKEIFKKQGLI